MTTYVLPVFDRFGDQVDVGLVDGPDGYPVVPLYSDTGTQFLTDNVPQAGPTLGEFPVLDESGTQWLIPFASGDVIGLYERTSNTLRAKLDEELSINFGLQVAWDNATAQKPALDATGALWADVSIDFSGGEEVIGLGHGSNRYRISGEARISLRWSLQRGDDVPLSYIEDIKDRLRDWTSATVTIEDPYHTTRERDGAWWTMDVLVPFRSDDDIDRPTPLSSGVVDPGTLHDTIRGLFSSLVSVPLSIETAWDNAAPPMVVGDAWCRARVITSTARTAGTGTTRIRRQVGILKVLVAGPVGSGDRDILRVVDAIANAFRARTSGGVRFQVPNVSVLGRQGASWVHVVDVPFTADEVV